MKTEPLSFDIIRLDAGTQSRAGINEDSVQDYCDVVAAAKPGEWPFPPLDVFHDGSEYFMSDGFHRLLGGKRAGRSSAPCVIHQGTAQDARIFSMTANDRNGLRMSRAEKRSCVVWLLDNCGKMTQKDIAAKAGVGERTVKVIVAERNSASIAGKASPPKQESKGQFAPYTPISGGKTPTSPKAPPKEVPEKTPEQSAAWQAQQQIKVWADTVGRWMSGHPSIDEYRDKFPGKCGDRVINATKELWEALEAWKKVLK